MVWMDNLAVGNLMVLENSEILSLVGVSYVVLVCVGATEDAFI